MDFMGFEQGDEIEEMRIQQRFAVTHQAASQKGRENRLQQRYDISIHDQATFGPIMSSEM
jgi:hypothetical protein